MGTKKMVSAMVTLIVAVILTVSLVVPVISDFSSESIMTKENVGAKASPVTESTTITFDGTDLLVGTNEFDGHVSLMCDNGFISYNAGKTSLSFATFDGRYDGLTSLNVTVDPTTKTVSGTYTNAGHTESTSLSTTYTDWCYVYDPDGEYVMNYYTSSSVDTPVYYNDINEIHAIYSGSGVNLAFTGTTVTGTDEGTAALTENSIDNVDDMKYIETRYNQSDLTYEYNDTTYVPPYICAKAVVDGTVEPINTYSTILSIIPILIIIGILFMAVSMFLKPKY